MKFRIYSLLGLMFASSSSFAGDIFECKAANGFQVDTLKVDLGMRRAWLIFEGGKVEFRAMGWQINPNDPDQIFRFQTINRIDPSDRQTVEFQVSTKRAVLKEHFTFDTYSFDYICQEY